MIKKFISWDNVEEAVYNIASRFNNIDYVVGINRGGLVPGVMISQLLEAPHIPITISLRDQNCIEFSESYERLHPHEKNVLVVDDINDSGATFSEYLDSIPLTSQINVFTTAIIEKHASTHTCDFAWATVENDDTWYVFPWEKK